MATSNLSIMSNFQASTPVDNEVNIDLDFYHTLFIYMRLLKFDNKTMSEKHKMKFDKDLFKVPNQRAFQLVVHFLFTKLDEPRSREIFRDVWPIIERKQEAEFRKKVRSWLVEVQEVKFNCGN
jgi:HAUS augmin-like complex subunit 6